MLGHESETRLKRFLVAVGDGETDLEGARQRLCHIRDFAPHSAFQRIDRDGTNFVTSFELLTFLRDHGNFTASENELYRLVRFFDCDEDGRLSFQDFLSMLLPCEDNLLRNVTLDRPSFRVGRYDSLPRDIEFGMLEVIDKELDLMRTQDVLRRELDVRYDYTIGAAFRSIDRYNDGRIDVHNLGAFLRSAGHYSTERELLSIVRRVDTDGDARIAFAEFSEFIGPGGGADIIEVKQPANQRSSPIRDPMPPKKRGRAKSQARPTMMTPKKAQAQRPQGSPSRVSPSKRPILMIPEEDQLVNSLKELCNLERELESAKIVLTNKQDFNLLDCFAIFDSRRVGVIGVHDIREGLSGVGVFPTTEEIELFMTRYDGTGDRRLNFNEFRTAFTACDTFYAHMLDRRPSNYRAPLYRRDDCFFADTQLEHRNVWRVHFQAETSSEVIRQRLQRFPCFNVYEAFNSLDLNDNGSVSVDELRRMIESRGFAVSDKEVRDLVDKFDKSGKGRISYAEFREEMLPKSPVRH